MAYDGLLASRIEEVSSGQPGCVWKSMFGGRALMVDGNMAVGVVGDELMVRVGPDDWSQALEVHGVREMDFTGRSLRGYVLVAADVLSDDDELGSWVDVGIGFARSLPPK